MNFPRLSPADRFFVLPIIALAVCLQPWFTFRMGSYNYSRWVETGFLVLFCVCLVWSRGRALAVVLCHRLMLAVLLMLG